MIQIKPYTIKDYVMENYSEQYETDPLFHMTIDKAVYCGWLYLDSSDFVKIISELCKFKYDETQFIVDMKHVENLLSRYLKDYKKSTII